MKRSHVKNVQIVFAFVLALALVEYANGQSCEGFDYSFTGGGIAGSIESRLNTFCTSSPQDLVQTFGDGLVVTIHNVQSRGTNGGTATCTNYPKQIVLTFSRPVADFQAGIFGAKTITTDTGLAMNLNPQLWPDGSFAPGRPMAETFVSFIGGGITSVTISDPFEYMEPCW